MVKEEKKYDICVVGGAGRAGLPLSVVMAKSGLKTVIFDINEDYLDKISQGIFPFKENFGPENLSEALEKNNLYTSSSPESITESEVVVMIVGTPLDDTRAPDLQAITRVVEEYLDYFQDGQILILRSTVFPGTSDKIQRYFRKKKKDISVAFCPERIAEGKAVEELSTLPQIISSFDEKTLVKVENIFKSFVQSDIIKLKPLEAELAKLFSNTWRYISFGVANQFYMISESHGVDYNSIYEAMTKNYKRAGNLPTAGFSAGPCLVKDTIQLSTFYNNNLTIGRAAMYINEGLPQFIVESIKKRLIEKDNRINFEDITVGILGMAFKAESDSVRDSLSYKFKKIAQFNFGEVICHDIYVDDASFVELDELLDRSNVVVLAAPHHKYKEINTKDYPNILFIDMWDFFDK